MPNTHGSQPVHENGHICPYALPVSDVHRHIRMIVDYYGLEATISGLASLTKTQAEQLVGAFAASICELGAIDSIASFSDPSAGSTILFPLLKAALVELADPPTDLSDTSAAKLLFLVLLFTRKEEQSFPASEREQYGEVCASLECSLGAQCDWKVMWKLVQMLSAKPASTAAAVKKRRTSASTAAATSNSGSTPLRHRRKLAASDPTPSQATSRNEPPVEAKRNSSLLRSDTNKVVRSGSYVSQFPEYDLPVVQTAVEMDYPEVHADSTFDGSHFSKVDYKTASRLFHEHPSIKENMQIIEETEKEQKLAFALLDICMEIRKSLQDSPSAFVECGDRRPADGEINQRPDFCLVDDALVPEPVDRSNRGTRRNRGSKTNSANVGGKKGNKYASVQVSFGHVHVIGELKTTRGGEDPIRKDGPTLSEVEKQVARYARNAFLRQNFRRHIHCFTLQGKRMRTLLFDRCGVSCSDSFDISLNPIRFVQTLASYLKMTRTELGYDPTYTEETAPKMEPVRRLAMTRTDDVYRLQEPIHQSLNLVGRATTVWKATKVRGSSASTKIGDTVIIKDSWQSVSRADEGTMLEQALSSEASLFSGAHEGHHISDWPQPRRFVTWVHHETVMDQGSIMDVYHHIRHMGRPDSSIAKLDGTSVAHSHCVREIPKDYDSANRELRRIVVKHVDCQKIEELDSLLDILTAIRDCVDGHWALFRSGLLHRDVSKDNLMAATKPRPGTNQKDLDYGFIIDLDFGADANLPTRVASGAPFATGNTAFMAREVLEWLDDCQNHYGRYRNALSDGNPRKIEKMKAEYNRHSRRFKQDYRHDLESFYWVLLFCLLRRPSNESLSLRNDVFQVDLKKPFEDALTRKDKHFTRVQNWHEYFGPLSDFTERWEGLEPLLVSFAGFISNISATLPAEELYCKFQRGLTEMIDHLAG